MGLFLFFAFFAMMVFAGREIGRRVWQGDRTGAGPFQQAATSALFTLAVTLALSWSLALPKMLTRSGLLAGAVFVLACAGVGWWRRSSAVPSRLGARAREAAASVREALRRSVDAEALCRLAVIVAVVALVAAGAFFLWRSATILTPNHDGSSYHLPKAAMLARAHGYETFDGPDIRVERWACDYELLLADVLLLDRSDVHTGWVSVGALIFFLLSVGALAERWWGHGRHVLVAVLLAAAMPVVLLHSDTHKNDVLTAALFVTAITFGARWAAAGGTAPLLVALTSIAIALGTKGSALFLMAGLSPLAAWGSVRRWRAGARPTFASIAAWCSGGIVLFLALGGMVYLRNAIETGSPVAVDPHLGYGDWRNVLRFPYLAFARPFSASTEGVWVPWRHTYWHWERYDLYFSEWGLPTSLLLFTLPFAVARYARRAPTGTALVFEERVAGSLVILLTFLIMLPLRSVPDGFFAATIRYTLFLPVLVWMWTAVPAVAELDARGGRGRLGVAAWVAASVAILGWYMFLEVTHDVVEPLDYVLAIAEHPEQRRSRRSAWNNSAVTLADCVAGPDDVIALDGAFDSGSYYLFGAELRRGVIYLHPERGLPVAISDETKWVVVDRIGAIAYGHPDFHDFGDWNKYLMKGKSSPEDLAVFNQLSSDPHFKLVYRYAERNQAIFERVSP